MTDAIICHDQQLDMWYIQRELHIEEIFPLTLEYIKDQQEENVALRDLLRDTLPFIAEEADYCVPSECFMYPACCEDTPDAVCLAVARIHERARELGVEL